MEYSVKFRDFGSNSNIRIGTAPFFVFETIGWPVGVSLRCNTLRETAAAQERKHKGDHRASVLL